MPPLCACAARGIARCVEEMLTWQHSTTAGVASLLKELARHLPFALLPGLERAVCDRLRFKTYAFIL